MGPKNYINKTMELLTESKEAFISGIKRGFGFYVPEIKEELTEDQIERVRGKTDSLKAKFEKKLKPVFNKWQSKVIKDFLKQMNSGSSVLKVSEELKIELSKLLYNHSLEVSESFVPGTSYTRKKQLLETTVDGAGEEENNNEEDFLYFQVIEDIEKEVQDLIKTSVPFHSGKIIETTENIGNSAKSASLGDPFEAEAFMRNKMAGRSTTVSVTETQWPAEGSEAIAIGVISPLMLTATEKQIVELQPVSPNVRLKSTNVPKLFASGARAEIDLFRRQLFNPQKMWITMQDKKVRASHNLMLGVTVGINQAFQLIGGLMMYPTDRSLGASFKEIVGCRCHLIYF